MGFALVNCLNFVSFGLKFITQPLTISYFCSVKQKQLMNAICRTVFPVVVLSLLAHFSFSQQADSMKVVRDSASAVNVTNTGISLVTRPDSYQLSGIFRGR